MTIEYDEHGKLFTDIVSKISIYVTIQTTTHMLRGRMYVSRDQRAKDELDRSESFLPLTDVQVQGPDGQALFHAPFLAVKRDHIVWVMPEQKTDEGGNS
jgi:hypothetical protein